MLENRAFITDPLADPTASIAHRGGDAFEMAADASPPLAARSRPGGGRIPVVRLVLDASRLEHCLRRALDG